MRALALAIICVSAVPAVVGSMAPDPGEAMPYGIDAAGALELAAAGHAPAYGTLWVGPWTLEHGWDGPMDTVARLQAAGITPVVHLYYWGDDISRACLQDGCWSDLHHVQKTPAAWDTLVAGLAQRLDGDVVVVLETEFNKADVQRWEPLDAMLADKADRIHASAPGAQVVLALGDWNPDAWGTWDRAAAASDMVGIQAMRAITRDDEGRIRGLFDETLLAARTLHDLFGKPVIVHDLAVSSYGGQAGAQGEVVRMFMDGAGALRAAGVDGVVYRSWRDTPMDTANHYGEAEQHWGLADRDGSAKPAGDAWLDVGQEHGPPWWLWSLPAVPITLLAVVPRNAARHPSTPA